MHLYKRLLLLLLLLFSDARRLVPAAMIETGPITKIRKIKIEAAAYDWI
jgi:hypothetical protein